MLLKDFAEYNINVFFTAESIFNINSILFFILVLYKKKINLKMSKTKVYLFKIHCVK